jgi:endoglucanase
MDVMKAWGTTVGKGMPVYIGEWGVGWGSRFAEQDCNNVRLWYQMFHHDIATPKGMPTSVWDDGGWFKIFDHASDSFANNLVDCINGSCDWTTGERINSACL